MKNILVTGASGGMGNTICRLLTEKGFQVYGLDCKEPDPDNTVMHFTTCNITDSGSVTAAFYRIIYRFGL